MKTITIQIGNSDDKLTQEEWSRFVRDVHTEIKRFSIIHFFGAPANWEPRQNACWVVAVEDFDIANIKEALFHFRLKYRQESAALTVGETELI